MVFVGVAVGWVVVMIGVVLSVAGPLSAAGVPEPAPVVQQQEPAPVEPAAATRQYQKYTWCSDMSTDAVDARAGLIAELRAAEDAITRASLARSANGKVRFMETAAGAAALHNVVDVAGREHDILQRFKCELPPSDDTKQVVRQIARVETRALSDLISALNTQLAVFERPAG